jgi:hypothetical protein
VDDPTETPSNADYAAKTITHAVPDYQPRWKRHCGSPLH